MTMSHRQQSINTGRGLPALGLPLTLVLLLGVAIIPPTMAFVSPSFTTTRTSLSTPSRHLPMPPLVTPYQQLQHGISHNPHPHSTARSSPLFASGAAAGVKRGAAKNSIVKGKLTLFLSKFIIGPEKALHIAKRLALTLKKDFLDLVLIGAIYQLVIPLAQKWYDRTHSDWDETKRSMKFERSKTHRIARLVQEIAFLFGLLFLFDMGLVLLDELGFEFVQKFPVYQWTAGIVASIWGARNLSEFKDFVLSKAGRIDITKNPGRRLVSRFLDIFLFGGTGLIILDFLSVQTGFALKSLFGLSSVGTLVFSLASREFVSEFLASLAIQGTNMYIEGDRILLADGTTGTVQKLGWLNTHLRRSDELVVRIPNTQISGKRVANISRSRLSTVKQALAISYEEIDKLPGFIEDLKEEIRKACPTLIENDGSRTFQIFFSDYKDTSVEVLISGHFRTRPFSEAYFELKQDVLMAIRRATMKHNVKFSYVAYANSGVTMLD